VQTALFKDPFRTAQ